VFAITWSVLCYRPATLYVYATKVLVMIVSVLAIGPKVCGFKPGQGRNIFKGDKIRSTSSFGGALKPSVPCNNSRHVKFT
jgi:hypothetical protein